MPLKIQSTVQKLGSGKHKLLILHLENQAKKYITKG